MRANTDTATYILLVNMLDMRDMREQIISAAMQPGVSDIKTDLLVAWLLDPCQ